MVIVVGVPVTVKSVNVATTVVTDRVKVAVVVDFEVEMVELVQAPAGQYPWLHAKLQSPPQMLTSSPPAAYPAMVLVEGASCSAPVAVHVHALMGQYPCAQLKLQRPARLPSPLPPARAGGLKSDTVGVVKGTETFPQAVGGQ
jgi:hypothetical protein